MNVDIPLPGLWVIYASAICGMGRNCKPVRVWDAPTRLFHWAATGLVAVLYLTWRYDRMDWHALAGEALLALLLFRLLWGFFGSDTARFACFVRSPREAIRHLARLLRREPDIQVGHNPAGGWMVLAMLALLLGETLTGLYVNNDVANDGPLTAIASARTSNFITDLHKILWTALLAAIALHVLAILVYAVVKRHDLVRPMLTGRKRLPEAVSAPRIASPSLGAVLLVFAAGAAALIAALL